MREAIKVLTTLALAFPVLVGITAIAVPKTMLEIILPWMFLAYLAGAITVIAYILVVAIATLDQNRRPAPRPRRRTFGEMVAPIVDPPERATRH